MRAQVVIVGGGPSGLLLGQLLHLAGIDAVVLERRDREYVLARIRAGVLETGLVDLLRQAGVADRLEREALIHNGTLISDDKQMFAIDFQRLVGKSVVVYGQTEVTRDLYDARASSGARTVFNANDVALHDLDTDAPFVTWQDGDGAHKIDCDFVAGCDGFHGVSRQSIPREHREEFEKIYPFAWLGVLSETPPVNQELIYSNSVHGFALCSMRNANLSRYYIQCTGTDRPENWTDQAFWDELRQRLPPEAAETLITGPAIEKSIAPLRSFVCEPMQWGRLFLCGDAAHIVPPTGAKGLNTAASDVHYLYQALRLYYQDGDVTGVKGYSEKALARVWKAERFSWWMTTLLHRFPDQSDFDRRIQKADLAFLRENEDAQRVMASNYVGLPY